MKKLGLALLFFTFFQLICVMITTQFYWIYKWSHGGVGGGILYHVHWLVWVILIIEFVISAALSLKHESK